MKRKGTRGRAVVCTQSLANLICERLAQGETLTSICKADGMPSASTVLKWAQVDQPIEYDGSEDVEALTGLDRALLEYRERVASIMAAAAEPKQGKKGQPGRTQKAREAHTLGVSGDKVDNGEGVSSVTFSGYYAHAREIGYTALADVIRDIADDSSSDTYVDSKGQERTNHEAINRSRLRVDVLRWTLSKMLPKTYSDHGVKIAVGDATDRAPDVILTGNDVDI